MRGQKKRRLNGFKKGHEQLNHKSKSKTVETTKRVVRLDVDEYRKVKQRVTEFSLLNSNLTQEPDCASENQIDGLSLRPRVRKSYLQQYQEKNDSEGEYILVHKQKSELFWNKVILEHHKAFPRCAGPVVDDVGRSQKMGTVWILAAKCTRCQYKSEKEKLYEEVHTGKRGRKAAATNLRLQIALSKNSISNTAMHHILSSMNVNPPSKSGLTQTANKVNDKIKEINIKDMEAQRQSLKAINNYAGLPVGLVDIEVDGTYNRRIGSGRPTPGQAATQTTYLCAENITADKTIINCKTYSRLCQCDLKHKSGPHKEHCKANLASNAIIGQEKTYLAQTLTDLHRDGLSVGDVTLDGDSSARSLLDSIEQPDENIKIRPMYCIRHLNQAVTKKVQEESFSINMFPGRLKADKKRAQNLFSRDIAARAQAEFNNIYDKYGSSLQDMINRASYVPEAIINCYTGSHSLCLAHSFVCTKEKQWNRTFIKSKYPQNAFISPTEEDKQKLCKILGLRFNRAAVNRTSKNRSQNKCEAANRGLTKAAPKNITFARNYEGRIHSAVHTMNHSLGKSTVILAEKVGAAYPCKSPALKSLASLDRAIDYHRQYKKTATARTARQKQREDDYLHYAERIDGDYNKSAALVEELYHPEASTSSDHSYSKPKRRRKLLTS
jgi:hypothetical protein